MLKSVTLENFFSFRNPVKIELNKGVNLLLGINGSGKTSFINALRILTDGVGDMGLMRLINEKWGGYGEIINYNSDVQAPYAVLTYVFDKDKLNGLHPSANFQNDVHYKITIHPKGTGYYLSEKICVGNNGFVLLDFRNGYGKISTRDSESGKIGLQDFPSDNISSQELALKQVNDPLHYLPLFVLRKAIESICVYGGFNVSEESAIRQPAEYSIDTRLRSNGSNLSMIINNIKNDNIPNFKEIEDKFRNVNPTFLGVDLALKYGKAYLTVRERNMGRTIGALHLSDGTLRFLLMESIFYNSKRGNVVAVDEPERGMHPDMIRTVADMMKHAARTSQIIAATHSPQLLNQFRLDDILVFEKDERNISKVERLKPSDFEDDEDQALLPGQMWLMGQIGGKRW